MNKLTVTRNGTTVTIEQDTPIGKDIIAETLVALGGQSADPTPFVSPPYPGTISPLPWPSPPIYQWTLPPNICSVVIN